MKAETEGNIEISKIYVETSWPFSIPDIDRANETQTEMSSLQHCLCLDSRESKTYF